MEKKIVPLTLLSNSDEDQGVVETIFAVFGNIDDGDDMMHPGSFSKTFRERGNKVKVLDQHKTDSIMRALGRPLELRELERSELPQSLLEQYPEATGGAYAKIQFLLNTPEGKGAFERIKAGVVDSWSFGYDTMQKDYSQIDGKRVRNLRQVKLYELGPVLFPMNPAVSTLSAKAASEAKPWGVFPRGERWCVYLLDEDGARTGRSLGCHATEDEAQEQVEVLYTAMEEDMSKQAVPYQDIPLAARERAWDGTAATRRVRDWAGYDPDDAEAMDWGRYRRAFLWYDADNADTLQAYKLPYADVVDGELQAVPRGLFAAAGVLQGARGGANIPDADQERIRAVVSRWYARMRVEFDDEGIVPSWEKAAPAVFMTDTEDKAANLSGYCAELARAFYQAHPDMLEGDDPRRLYVEEVWDTFLVVREEHAGGVGLYRVDYVVEDGQPLFVDREEWVMGQRVFTPLPATMQTSGKAGRIISQRNADRLARAMAELTDILTEAGYLAPAQQENEANTQEEHAGAGPSPTPTPRPADLLQQIDIEMAEIGFAIIA